MKTKMKKEKHSLYDLFQKILKEKKNKKMSEKNIKYMSTLGSTLKHKKFEQFFKKSAEITLTTSASKRGWMPEIFLSSWLASGRTLEDLRKHEEMIQKEIMKDEMQTRSNQSKRKKM